MKEEKIILTVIQKYGGVMTDKTDENRKIWDQLKETDPRLTKKINKGFGDLTTIDPHWQIMKMTEIFGPVGKGWSYDVKYHYFETYISAEVTIRWNINNNWLHYGPIASVQKLTRGKSNTFDDECTKKAMTDALTKGFSHLGLCADVFMGKFDDSKYVEKLTEKYSNVNKDKIKEV